MSNYKIYYYDNISFKLTRIRDNGTNILFDVKIHCNNLFQTLRDEILNNPKKYPKLNTFFNQLTESKRHNILEKYIYLYPGDEYQDKAGDYLEYNTFSVKVKLQLDEGKLSVNVYDIYYDNIYKQYKNYDYEKSVKEMFGNDTKTLNKFTGAMDEYLIAYHDTTTMLINEAVDKYFMDIVDDNIIIKEINKGEKYEEEYNEVINQNNEGGLAP